MLPKAIRDKIEERFGDKLISKLCSSLSEDIFQKTKMMVSETSLQRMFGFTGDHDAVKQRRSTLDIIAKYVGYDSYELLSKDVDEDTEISEFSHMESINSSDLNEGSQVVVTYQPGRMIVMTYLGNNQYIINESVKSKLRQGDKIEIISFVIGFELLIKDVIRDGKSLGSYEAAKVGGLTSIEVLNPEN